MNLLCDWIFLSNWLGPSPALFPERWWSNQEAEWHVPTDKSFREGQCIRDGLKLLCALDLNYNIMKRPAAPSPVTHTCRNGDDTHTHTRAHVHTRIKDHRRVKNTQSGIKLSAHAWQRAERLICMHMSLNARVNHFCMCAAFFPSASFFFFFTQACTQSQQKIA